MHLHVVTCGLLAGLPPPIFDHPSSSSPPLSLQPHPGNIVANCLDELKKTGGGVALRECISECLWYCL